jgi:hypothetical protein
VKCAFCGRIDFPGCRGMCGEWEYEPEIDLENGRRLNLQSERISHSWLAACERRARTRVARAGFRRAARAQEGR